jgi:acetyl esterase/lipase
LFAIHKTILDNKNMHQHKKTILSFFIILSACTTQGSVSTSSQTPLPSSSVSITSSSTSIDPIYFNQSMLYGLDDRQIYEMAYLRDRNGPSPVVLFIHGGSWAAGDKSMMRRYLDQILNDGLVYVSMNYRLVTGGATYLDMIADIASVIDSLKRSANTHQIDISQMAIVGESAGAHLALLYAYTTISAIPIDFVTALVPPLDFTDPGYLLSGDPQLQLFLANALMGTTLADASELETNGYPASWIDASPITHLDQAVPTLMAYAEKDELIPLSNNLRFLAEAEAVDAPIEAMAFPNSGHNLGNDPETLILFMNRFSEYLINYLIA